MGPLWEGVGGVFRREAKLDGHAGQSLVGDLVGRPAAAVYREICVVTLSLFEPTMVVELNHDGVVVLVNLEVEVVGLGSCTLPRSRQARRRAWRPCQGGCRATRGGQEQ